MGPFLVFSFWNVAQAWSAFPEKEEDSKESAKVGSKTDIKQTKCVKCISKVVVNC